jgi:ribosome-binding protein aMBF1 (putative translation factor)
MQDPEFAAAYDQHRARIDAVDELMRALDEAREGQGLTKATLARRINAEPAAVRRLFSQANPNPQIGRVVDVAHELGLEIVVQPKRVTPRRRAAGSRRQRARLADATG